MSDDATTKTRSNHSSTSRWEKRIGSVHGCTKSPDRFCFWSTGFPGGKADEQDFDEALIPFLTGHDANQDMRAAQVSAIREASKNVGSYLQLIGALNK